MFDQEPSGGVQACADDGNKIIEAIENNVLGTRRVAAAAARYGANRFVLISTDKAVHPASVMGAFKRMAELVVKAMNAGTSKTCFCAGAVWERVGEQWKRRADVQEPDCGWGSGEGDRCEDDAVLHDESRGVAVGSSGIGYGS